MRISLQRVRQLPALEENGGWEAAKCLFPDFSPMVKSRGMGLQAEMIEMAQGFMGESWALSHVAFCQGSEW